MNNFFLRLAKAVVPLALLSIFPFLIEGTEYAYAIRMLGIMGLYIGRIHAEVKRRPLYVVSQKLGFERETTSTGWKASMLLLVQDGVVVYKLWSGTPTILEVKTEKRPLGPFQDLSGPAAAAVSGAIKP